MEFIVATIEHSVSSAFTKAKVLAKNGARLPTVCYTVIGTRTAPSENEIRPINPITLRTKSDFLSCGST